MTTDGKINLKAFRKDIMPNIKNIMNINGFKKALRRLA